MSFLDLTVRQVEYLNQNYGVDVPLILMNSFKTDEVCRSDWLPRD
jgi:UTP--glucose-1-phosphate uridylyltransferase